jgi:rhodanese-related sulfurtransferase
MRVNWKRFILILVTGVAANLAWNATSNQNFALGQSVLVQVGDEIVEAKDAKTLLDRNALFLDARPRDFWRMSRIPNALPLPEKDFERSFAEIEPSLHQTSGIVVYCSGFECETSHLITRKLREQNLIAAILNKKIPTWQNAKLPMDSKPRS